jgi:hypothetical protein
MGAISFPFTQLLFPDLAGQITMAAAFGAFVLLVQFLIDFEHRLEAVEHQLVKTVEQMRQVVEEGFAKVNDFTQLLAKVETGGLSIGAVAQLMHDAGEISPQTPPLVSALANYEVGRVSVFLRELAKEEAKYDGEDQEWLLELTRKVKKGIDAISLPEVDAAGNSLLSFWDSPLGHRYLTQQHEAIRRGVRVRRIFVVQPAQLESDAVLRQICRAQTEVGVEVRILLPGVFRGSLDDFIVFDNSLSYEVTPATHVESGPMIVNTRLDLRSDRVAERIEDFRKIWSLAVPWSDFSVAIPVPYSPEPEKQLLEEGML